MSKRHITLLGIDWQNDFCHKPDPNFVAKYGFGSPYPEIDDPQFPRYLHPEGGALYVAGADEDAARLTTMLKNHGGKIDSVRFTLDSHQKVHIAHPIMHVDENGKHPAPFTLITAQDYRDGKYRAANPAHQKIIQDYLNTLETNGRYPFIIWNPHCLIGSWGHSIVPELRTALERYYEDRGRLIDWVTKGSNPTTEHYSAVQADVPHPQDPSTQINMRFIGELQKADDILITGQALSHCVANTIRDVAAKFGDEHVKKFVLITDASSPVGDLPGSTMFKDMADSFVKELTAKGMRTATTVDFFA